MDEAWLPPPEERQEESYETVIDVDNFIITRMETDLRGVILNFAVAHVTRHAGRKVRVATFDICHRELHMHLFSRSSGTEQQVARRVFRRVDNLNDVQDAYDDAQDLVVEMWEENRRRWRHG